MPSFNLDSFSAPQTKKETENEIDKVFTSFHAYFDVQFTHWLYKQ